MKNIWTRENHRLGFISVDDMLDRITELEETLKHYRDAWPAIRMQLMEIRAKAKFEQEHPTGLHMTCLSLIEKAADKALNHAPNFRLI